MSTEELVWALVVTGLDLILLATYAVAWARRERGDG